MLVEAPVAVLAADTWHLECFVAPAADIGWVAQTAGCEKDAWMLVAAHIVEHIRRQPLAEDVPAGHSVGPGIAAGLVVVAGLAAVVE